MRKIALIALGSVLVATSASAGSLRSTVDNTIRNEVGKGHTVTKTNVHEVTNFENYMEVQGITDQVKLEAIAPEATAFIRFDGDNVWGGANTSTTALDPVDPIILIQSTDVYEGYVKESGTTTVEQFSVNKEKYRYNESFIEAGSTFSF